MANNFTMQYMGLGDCFKCNKRTTVQMLKQPHENSDWYSFQLVCNDCLSDWLFEK